MGLAGGFGLGGDIDGAFRWGIETLTLALRDGDANARPDPGARGRTGAAGEGADDSLRPFAARHGGHHEEHDQGQQGEDEQARPQPVARRWSHRHAPRRGVPRTRPSAPRQDAPKSTVIIVVPPSGRTRAWTRHPGFLPTVSITRLPSSNGPLSDSVR